MNSALLFTLLFVVLFYFYLRLKNQKAAMINEEIGSQFLTENSKRAQVTTTESGLQYEVLHKGTGDKSPQYHDIVRVHYHGQLINGTVFDSSVQRGETISFGLNQVIAGWTEGLQLMQIGDKMRFYIPAALGYGNRSVGKIPAGSVLIFDVELFEIE